MPGCSQAPSALHCSWIQTDRRIKVRHSRAQLGSAQSLGKRLLLT